jgi:uncharacterized protein
VGEFSVNIIGLSKKAHEFTFELGKTFFDEFGKDLLEDGHFDARVVLDKHETFIDANFHISGAAKLICDRSLEPFDFPVDVEKKMMFKYGEAEMEMTDEIMVIPQDKATLNLGQFLYEYIALALPMKRIHPKFQEDEEEDDDETPGKIIYTSKEDQPNEGTVDPRWEALKKL